MASDARSMPLICNICPKLPHFSDVSHLLTHVGSKGHLSNYYRMKVRGSQDPVAQKTVAEYDAWYNEWNVDDMMRERMSQKEKKRSTSGHVSRRPLKTTKSSSRSASTVSHGVERNHNFTNAPYLDPQLDRRIKIEPPSRSVTPAHLLAFEDPTLLRTYAPPMQSTWITPYDFAEPVLKQEYVSSSLSDESLEQSLLPLQRSWNGARYHRPSPSLMSIPSLPSMPDDDRDPAATITDSSKLKGIYWPGMAMFDAAPPEVRRKRNQKKERSVLEQLQTTSEIVEPTEFVFDQAGTLRKQRPITGHPESDDSPVEGESSPPQEMPDKKRARKTRARRALNEKHPNSGRSMRQHRESRTKSSNHGLSRSQGPSRSTMDEDDSLTYLESRPKARRSGLSIHRDNSGPEITFNNPAPFNVLTSSFRDPLRTTSQIDAAEPYDRLAQVHVARSNQRLGPWALNGSFRPTAHSSMTLHSFPSFGQYISRTIGHAANQSGPFGRHNLSVTDQLFPGSTRSLQTQTSTFSSHHPTGSAWNMFDLDNQDLSIPDTVEHTLPLNNNRNNHNITATTSSAGLFFDNGRDRAQDDDEATISAASEH